MIRVGINGYGTIGKRVADAVRAQPGMRVAGVAKRSPDYAAVGADETGYDLYAEDAAPFSAVDITPAGGVEDLVRESDVVVDATPSGVGAENRPLYERHDTPAIFQGGEDATVAEASFNARANFAEASEADYVRVVSCNTTGLSRLLAPIEELAGIEKARVTLVRRGGDPTQTSRGPINDVVPDPVSLPSHHGPDVRTIFPELAIDTIALRVPTTMMHVHAVNVSLAEDADAGEIRDRLAGESRLLLVPGYAGIEGTGGLRDLAGDAGRPRNDVWENAIWEESIAVRDGDLYCLQAIHQESNVVPENVDAIRAIAGEADAAESMATTNEALGIGLERFEGRERAADRQIAD
ncbi:type II glyceraldehyde-3-phosphate dehydrogenase [Saliphagus infecundisoli]|uniref:Glyceraldehyde-3-phosphate dehydrogenase n=1 Tax=Saliphagus infecundisoli TaxID=1849069 RepID=A0ABD5QDZ1_9EURY|nr:type II glyceraldehyde-3-phosphate dehydrogenase [Saliphagus infecundisoli]